MNATLKIVVRLCHSALNLNMRMSTIPLPKKLLGRCKKFLEYDSCLPIKSHLDYKFS